MAAWPRSPAQTGFEEVVQGTIVGFGHNFASRTGDQVRNWDGDFMLRKNSASSRLVRVGVFGLVTLTSAAISTTDAQARRHYRHHQVSHHDDSDDDYSPNSSSI